MIEDNESHLFLESLKHLIIGGEKLPEEIVEKLSVLTKAAIYNMYGPTETTIWSTSKKIDFASKVTIGKPIQNTSIYILDVIKIYVLLEFWVNCILVGQD